MPTVLLLALLLLLPIVALAIALAFLYRMALVDAEVRAFDSSIDHVKEDS